MKCDYIHIHKHIHIYIAHRISNSTVDKTVKSLGRRSNAMLYLPGASFIANSFQVFSIEIGKPADKVFACLL